jgi:hypothetical protein
MITLCSTYFNTKKPNNVPHNEIILIRHLGYRSEQHWWIGFYNGDGCFLRGTNGIFMIQMCVRKTELHSTTPVTGGYHLHHWKNHKIFRWNFVADVWNETRYMNLSLLTINGLGIQLQLRPDLSILIFCILKGINVSQETSYLTETFHGYPRSVQESTRIVSRVQPRIFPHFSKVFYLNTEHHKTHILD